MTETCLQTTKKFDNPFFPGLPSAAIDADLRIGIDASAPAADAEKGDDRDQLRGSGRIVRSREVRAMSSPKVEFEFARTAKEDSTQTQEA